MKKNVHIIPFKKDKGSLEIPKTYSPRQIWWSSEHVPLETEQVLSETLSRIMYRLLSICEYKIKVLTIVKSLSGRIKNPRTLHKYEKYVLIGLADLLVATSDNSFAPCAPPFVKLVISLSLSLSSLFCSRQFHWRKPSIVARYLRRPFCAVDTSFRVRLYTTHGSLHREIASCLASPTLLLQRIQKRKMKEWNGTEEKQKATRIIFSI